MGKPLRWTNEEIRLVVTRAVELCRVGWSRDAALHLAQNGVIAPERIKQRYRYHFKRVLLEALAKAELRPVVRDNLDALLLDELVRWWDAIDDKRRNAPQGLSPIIEAARKRQAQR